MAETSSRLYFGLFTFITIVLGFLFFAPYAHADNVTCSACGNTVDESCATEASGCYICDGCIEDIASNVEGTGSDNDITSTIEDWLYQTSSNLAAIITADLLFNAVKSLIITTTVTDNGALIWTYNSVTDEATVEINENIGTVCGGGFYVNGRLVLCMQCRRYLGSETEQYSIITDYSRMIVCDSCGNVLCVFA